MYCGWMLNQNMSEYWNIQFNQYCAISPNLTSLSSHLRNGFGKMSSPTNYLSAGYKIAWCRKLPRWTQLVFDHTPGAGDIQVCFWCRGTYYNADLSLFMNEMFGKSISFNTCTSLKIHTHSWYTYGKSIYFMGALDATVSLLVSPLKW